MQATTRNLKVNEEQHRSQSRRRRFCDEEFKRNAVELLEAGGRSAVQLSRELGISDCSLGKWKRKYGQQAHAALKGSEAEQSRIMELERELTAVTRQRDILKKALAILGQEPNSSTK
jgi:transposase